MDAAFKIRKHLTPPTGLPATLGMREKRRDTRRDVSERVTLRGPRGTWEGWTLNVSRGGVRVIVEAELQLGEVFELTVGLADASPLVRPGRVVWFQEEADGYIAGVAFLTGREAESSAPPSQ